MMWIHSEIHGTGDLKETHTGRIPPNDHTPGPWETSALNTKLRCAQTRATQAPQNMVANGLSLGYPAPPSTSPWHAAPWNVLM